MERKNWVWEIRVSKGGRGMLGQGTYCRASRLTDRRGRGSPTPARHRSCHRHEWQGRWTQAPPTSCSAHRHIYISLKCALYRNSKALQANTSLDLVFSSLRDYSPTLTTSNCHNPKARMAYTENKPACSPWGLSYDTLNTINLTINKTCTKAIVGMMCPMVSWCVDGIIMLDILCQQVIIELFTNINLNKHKRLWWSNTAKSIRSGVQILTPQ